MVTEVSVRSEWSGATPEAGGKSVGRRRGEASGCHCSVCCRACVSPWECAVGSCPLTKLRCCEADFTTWRTIGCDCHVPC